MAHMARWRQTLNIQDDAAATGLLKTYRTRQAYAKAVESTQKLQSLGLKADCLTTRETIKTEPALAAVADNIYGGIFYPDDYKADAHLFCQALANAVGDMGGDIITGTTVESLLTSEDKIVGVQTAQETYRAGTTIIACGARSLAWLHSQNNSPRLARALKPLRMQPVKGYSLTFKNVTPAQVRPGVVHPKMPVVDESLHCAVTPFSHGLRIAGTAEITGFDPSEHPKRLAPLLGMLRDLYPDIARGLTLGDADIWHGFRPVSADGKPIITKLIPGLALNTGQSHMGWTQCAGSAEKLAYILMI